MARPGTAPFTLTVAETLRLIRDGRFRPYAFHRPFAWTSQQSVPFFESIIAGLPTGTIVVTEGPAEAERIQFGSIGIDATADPLALWVLDGVQRLSTLAGALLGDDSTPASLRLVYDVETESVTERKAGTTLLSHQLPLDALNDTHRFTARLLDLEAYSTDAVERAVDVRTQILNYPLLLVRMSGVSSESAAEVFVRLNANGVALSRADLFHARHPRTDEDSDIDLRAIADRLAGMGLGRSSENVALDIIQMSGITENDTESRAPNLTNALTKATDWLRDEAGIPHLSLWQPHANHLPTLVRFFQLNPSASPRARILLRRWLWRAMTSPRHSTSRYAGALLHGEDSADAARLLRHVPSKAPANGLIAQISKPLALAALGPRSLATGALLPLSDLMAEHGHDVSHLLAGVPILSAPDDGDVESLIDTIDDPDLLASHALSAELVETLKSGDVAAFRKGRKRLLGDLLRPVVARYAEWGASDRPAISALLVTDDVPGGDLVHVG
ncbi:DUF262 domain-containing protein [Actinoplanes sp. NPDC051851]|uniref:DUF262 domain-containing protein n=1 Tax=Actinoplanes sp. NPDC051851 TaxID=3154753 RepID=UPI00342B7F19